MGAFNTLITDITCCNCKSIFNLKLQFKFGDTWQLEYRIGDHIKWGGNNIGEPNLPKVIVYGIAESSTCLTCGYTHSDEYDFLIKNDYIVQINPTKNLNRYFEHEGCYFIGK